MIDKIIFFTIFASMLTLLCFAYCTPEDTKGMMIVFSVTFTLFVGLPETLKFIEKL